MRLLKQALAVLGALVVFAVIAALVAPKRAHALVAALVQVVPGTTTHVGQNESQLVSLVCFSSYKYCVPISTSALTSPSDSAYVVPSGYTLIVTDYQWYSTGSAGTVSEDFLFNSSVAVSGGNGIFASGAVIADKNGNTYGHEHFATGIRVASGVTIADFAAFESKGSANVQGYLVPND